MSWTNLLTERTAIITGAASGIGKAAARLFAEHGARVVIADVNEQGGRAVEGELRAAGHEALFVRTDVSSARDTAAMVARTMERWGRIDVLYNNAATTTLCNERDRAVHELDEAVWDTMLAVCLKGVFLCSKHVLPVMMERRSGVILNTTSVDALVAEPGFDSYTAAKGGVIALTRSMAAEYAPYGIRVNVIAPGYVITECQLGWYTSDPAARAKAEALHLTRLGQPEDIANIALYLASDLAAFVTGSVITVDGGFTAFKGTAPFRQSQT